MKDRQDFHPLKNLSSDLPASVIVFLVAMPLCLGVALASGAPLFSGLIAGMVGGLIVGAASGSPLGVSGPAAGLAVIVFNAIAELPSFEVFLLAVLIAGIFQVLMGFARAGIIAYYFPSSVVHGMLAGIGILIFMKQLPHAVGYDADPEGDFSFSQVDGQNTFSELFNMFNYLSPGVILVSVISLGLLILWETPLMKRQKIAKLIQGPLVVVVLGVFLGLALANDAYWNISLDHMVTIPVADTLPEFLDNFATPDFSAWNNPAVWRIAAILALVASIETLLCVEASDKQDTYKRTTPVNQELKAQGLGNIVCGLIGGIPVSQVIVRSSVNQQSGGKTKASAIAHGLLLLLSIVLIPTLLNLIPLATLAAILMVVGYKLAKPALFKKMYQQGWTQFVPFIVTVLGILFTNLLTGIGLGMAVAILIILYNNYKVPYRVEKSKKHQTLRLILSEDVTFLNKASIQAFLMEVPEDITVIIDASATHFIHHDVLELIEDFEISAKQRNITLQTIDLYKDKENQTHATSHFNVIAED
ncbi:MAG: SulP family inorganic anion transporter [Aureispira sp.]